MSDIKGRFCLVPILWGAAVVLFATGVVEGAWSGGLVGCLGREPWSNKFDPT